MKDRLPVTPVVLFGLLVALPWQGSAADLYVSSSGSYDGKDAYTDLQKAIDDAKGQDTVWVENGFVCSEGQRDDPGTGASRIAIGKQITLRSRSGDLSDPAIIRGSLPAEGGKAVRCLSITNTRAKVIGFRLEGGAAAIPPTEQSKELYSGGGCFGNGTISNCLVTGNQAGFGGGVSGNLHVHGCVISNNYARYSSGGMRSGWAYDSRLVANRSDGDSGAFRWSFFERCVIDSNHAVNAGGAGISTGQSLVDCVITNNVSEKNGGALSYMPVLVRCLVGWNRSGGAGGGASGGAITAPVRATNCTFVGNYAGQNGGGANAIAASNCTFAGNYSMGKGGGTCDSILEDCVVTGNVASNNLWGTGNGGGVSGGRLYRSRIVGNHARSEGAPNIGHGCGGGIDSAALVIDCVISNNTSHGRSGGVADSIVYNSLIIKNHAGGDGGGCLRGTYYNTLFLYNEADGGVGGAAYEAKLNNCTVYGNKGSGKGGVGCDLLVNTIVWNNEGAFPESVNAATNSVGACCTDDKGPGNRVDAPGIPAEGPYPFLPGPGSICKDRGLLQPWMTDETDPRSRDRNGRRRIIGSAVDIGALEAPRWGTGLFLR